MKSFILFLALSTPLFARLGETMEQCVERYGKPTKTDEEGTEFLKSGIKIRVRLYQDKVVSIIYNRKEPKLTKAEIKSLLETNLPGVKLTLVESDPDSYEDKDRRYRVLEGSVYLIIRDCEGSSQLDKQDEARQKAEADKSLKGF